MRPWLIYVIAGEASGDALGAGLMAALSAQLGGNVRFYGVGGERMQALGLKSLFPYHELSLMGFAEILPHVFSLLARVQQVVDDVAAKQPDVVVTIDSPGFNFRVAKGLRKQKLNHTRLVHYVAPSVWAYKPKRAAACARLFDHMLCLLPFEPPYFTREGLAASFVGHPVVQLPLGDGGHFREKHQLAPAQPLICLMPGSRAGEVKRLMPIFGRAMTLLANKLPELALTVPVSPRLLPMLLRYFDACPFRAVLVTEEGEKWDAFAASDVALVKSGTSSLEVAHAGLAQVVAYRAHPVTAWIVRRMIRIPYASLVNILLGREAVPELLQERCTPEQLAAALLHVVKDPSARQAQRDDAGAALAMLTPPGGEPTGVLAARVIAELLEGTPNV